MHSVLRRFSYAPWPLLFAVCAAAAIVQIGSAQVLALPFLCSDAGQLVATGARWSALLWIAFALNPPAQMAAGWLLMLLAMMPPLLAAPLMHVWRSSLLRRRVRATALFASGYGAAWLAAGGLFVGSAIAIRVVAGSAAPVVGIGLALVWSASPAHRGVLNRSHRLPRLGLFGWRGDRDCAVFGMTHGLWCIASCWGWMLLPFLAGRAHLLAMVLAGAIMLASNAKARISRSESMSSWALLA